MGICLSRKKKYIYPYHLDDNNIDNIIKGRLHVNNNKYFYTTIYFYKNYLYIINEELHKIINYKNILCWDNNLNNFWISFKIIEGKKILIYKLYLYKNKDNKIILNKIKDNKIILNKIKDNKNYFIN
tara:strand:- start:9034 stop:9414 length:381 start_codon:yes stop_codon:yes gene_type:complete